MIGTWRTAERHLPQAAIESWMLHLLPLLLFSFILLDGYQQPVHAGVCGVMCAGKKIEKDQKVGIHWPEKATS